MQRVHVDLCLGAAPIDDPLGGGSGWRDCGARLRRAGEHFPPILDADRFHNREPSATRTMIPLSPTVAHQLQCPRNLSASVL